MHKLRGDTLHPGLFWLTVLALACTPPSDAGGARLEASSEPHVARPDMSFVGTHAFNLLDKLAHEATDDAERRRIVTAVLDDAASRGATVLRFWGTLKQTGSADEVARASALIALTLDENARRERPLRFVITLLNHQAGYGAPDPRRSLDDQEPGSGWHAPHIYLEGGWREPGRGMLADRIEALARLPEAASPHVLAWELVNELDLWKTLEGGFGGEDGEKVRKAFLLPALARLAAALPQPLMIGDIRGPRDDYERWAEELIETMPAAVRARLVWTTHVYAEHGADPETFLGKLDIDMRLAKKFGRPFLLGELGQHVPGAKTSLCKSYARHDLGPLLAAVASRGVEAMLIWGEGMCGLDIGGRKIIVGAGSDSAELDPNDAATGELLRGKRRP